MCYRQQRVVVNGAKSDCAPVLRALFLDLCHSLLHINDITSDIESEIRLFADGCVCYHEINLNGSKASSAPALWLNTIIFKHVYWYMQQSSGERLQDHWSSGFNVTQKHLNLPGIRLV